MRLTQIICYGNRASRNKVSIRFAYMSRQARESSFEVVRSDVFVSGVHCFLDENGADISEEELARERSKLQYPSW